MKYLRKIHKLAFRYLAAPDIKTLKSVVLKFGYFGLFEKDLKH